MTGEQADCLTLIIASDAVLQLTRWLWNLLRALKYGAITISKLHFHALEHVYQTGEKHIEQPVITFQPGASA